MATCDVQTTLEDGACWGCLDQKQRDIAKLTLLCRISRILDPMASCDPETVLEEGACWGCIAGDRRQAMIAELQLLCNLSPGGGSGGMGGASSGPADPVAPPVSGNGTWLNTTTNSFWTWNPALGIWVEQIA